MYESMMFPTRKCFKLYRIKSFTKFIIDRSNYCTGNDNLKSLCKYLELNKEEASVLQKLSPNVKNLNDKEIIDLKSIMYDLGLPKYSIFKEPVLVRLKPIMMKYRLIVLKECGINNVSVEHVGSFFDILKKKKVGELKKSGLISPTLNVENKLASCLSQSPSSLTTLVDGDPSAYTLFALRIKIIQRFLEIQLDMDDKDFVKQLKTYSSIQHRPLSAINEILHTLLVTIEIPIDVIKSNFFLLTAHDDNLQKILFNFKSIGGINIKDIIRKYPVVAMVKCSKLLEINAVLKEFGISADVQKFCIRLYTLSPATIRQRLEQATEMPQFNIFRKDRNFLQLILSNKVALKRIDELKEKNKECVSINYLRCSTIEFKDFLNKQDDGVKGGRDILLYISDVLGNVYSCDDIYKKVHMHPFWSNIPLLRIKQGYEKLSLHFSSNDIYENCPILLYTWHQVDDVLNSLNQSSKCTAFSLLKERIDLNNISKTQKLSLILYLLEVKHNYSGDGVWTE